jgi:hypothetical protein
MSVHLAVRAGLGMVIMVSSPNARKGTLVTNIMRSVWIVTAETPTLQLREKTITIATFSGFTIGILVTFINPYMQEVMGISKARLGSYTELSLSLLPSGWLSSCPK